MNGPDPKTKAPLPATTTDGTAVPRSGSGAGTALTAMLKKRQMRPSRDTEPEVPDSTAKESPGE